MSDTDRTEKLIITLGQRIGEQNEILKMIAASLQGTAVEWNGQVFTRRSPSNKFDAAIWFSRCIGKDADSNNRYARLIYFKDGSEAEPIDSSLSMKSYKYKLRPSARIIAIFEAWLSICCELFNQPNADYPNFG